MHISDDILVQHAQRGSERAFRELVERYQERILNVCYRILGNREDAEEATMESFLACYRSLDSFEGRASFATWMYRIAIHTASKQRRGQTKAEMVVDGTFDIPVEPLVDHQLREREIRQAVEHALDQLPESLRVTIVLYFLEGLSYRQIAEILECPIGTVGSRINQARSRLQRQLRYLMEE